MHLVCEKYGWQVFKFIIVLLYLFWNVSYFVDLEIARLK